MVKSSVKIQPYPSSINQEKYSYSPSRVPDELEGSGTLKTEELMRGYCDKTLNMNVEGKKDLASFKK